jgi:hypothetical protein
MSNKWTRKVQFNNTRTRYAPELPTPAHVTGFNRTNPFSLAEGWQTKAELARARIDSRRQKEMLASLSHYKPPFAYRDPHFVYPREARGNIASTAEKKYSFPWLKYKREIEMNNNKLIQNNPNHVVINVKPATRRRTRRHRR